MNRLFLPALGIGLFLASCTTDMDRKLKPISSFDRFLSPSIVADSLPDSLARHLQGFAMAYPKHKNSEQYLYAATLLSERAGRPFETAKWCEAFVAHYPGSKWLKPATVAAAHNFEKTGVYDKAIKFYDMAASQQPDTDIGKQCAQTAKMLKRGLITPEQQLEYILNKQKDTAAGK